MDSVVGFWNMSVNSFVSFLGLGMPMAIDPPQGVLPSAETVSPVGKPEPAPCPGKTAVLTQTQRQLLEHWIRCPTLPQRLIIRCRILVALDDGNPKYQIAREVGKDIKVVRKWSNRWEHINVELSHLETTSIKPRDYRLRVAQALNDATRRGRPISFTAEQVVRIIAMACEVKDASDEATSQWTRSELVWEATQRGIVDRISKSTVGRFLGEARIKPHKSRYWLNTNPEDPEQFDQQVRVICRLYEEAPMLHEQGEHLVSTDEKTGIQALQRLHPTRPASREQTSPKASYANRTISGMAPCV